MKNFIKKILFILFVLFFINGCSSINKEKAESNAVEFVNKNVKFFAREGDSALDLPTYSIDSIRSYQQNKDWIVVMHITSKVDNEEKKNDLMIKINKKGDVIEFNGRKVPKDLR